MYCHLNATFREPQIILLIRSTAYARKVVVRNWSGTFGSLFYITKRNIRDRYMTAMELLTLHLNNIKIPTNSQKIYKDECVFSFDTPVSSLENLSVSRQSIKSNQAVWTFFWPIVELSLFRLVCRKAFDFVNMYCLVWIWQHHPCLTLVSWLHGVV
jgi:hypothetical protein